MKYIHLVAPGLPDTLYLGIVYVAAALAVSMLLVARRCRRFDRATFALGMVGAALTVVQLYCMVAALRTLPSTLVYLSVFGGGPILVVLVSTLLLRERYGPRVWAATVAGICGIGTMLL